MFVPNARQWAFPFWQLGVLHTQHMAPLGTNTCCVSLVCGVRRSPLCLPCAQLEMAAEARGYTATKHQREVGTGYFDVVSTVCSNGASSTLALIGSTEASQF